MYRTVCCVIPSPILLVRTSFHTVFSCDNNSVFITLHSEHQQLFWWHVSNKAPSAASMYTAVYSYMCRVFLGGLGCFPLLYVLTSCVLRHPVSYFVSAYLVSYCLLVLLVRQQQRFHHPTLRTTSVTLVGCIEKIKGCRV